MVSGGGVSGWVGLMGSELVVDIPRSAKHIRDNTRQSTPALLRRWQRRWNAGSGPRGTVRVQLTWRSEVEARGL